MGLIKPSSNMVSDFTSQVASQLPKTIDPTDLLNFVVNNSLKPSGGIQFIDPFLEDGTHVRTGPWIEGLWSGAPNGHFYNADGGTSAAKFKVTFVGIGISLLTYDNTSTTRTIYASIDGGAFTPLTGWTAPGGNVVLKPLVSGLVYGSHTVEFYVNEAVRLYVMGFMVITDPSPRVDAGIAYVSGTKISPSATTLTPAAISTSKSRVDLIGVNNAGAVTLTQGLADTSVKAYRVEGTGEVRKWYLKNASGRFIMPTHANPTMSDGPKIWKSGTWTESPASGASTGTLYQSPTTGDYITIGFVGTGLDVVAWKGSSQGIVGVAIDGGVETTYDLYSASSIYQVSISVASGLSYGYHQVKIRVTGTKNASSASTQIYLDAYDVYVPAVPATPVNTLALGYTNIMPTAPTGTGAMAPSLMGGWVRYEEDRSVGYIGTWTAASSPAYSGGSLRYSAITNDYFEFAFIGTGFRYVADVTSNAGICAVSIDGGAETNVDMYASSTIYQKIAYVVTGLSFGFHVIKVRVTGTKNASSSGYEIHADAFDVLSPIEVVDIRNFSPTSDQIQKIIDIHTDVMGNPHTQYPLINDVGYGVKRNLRIEVGEYTFIGMSASSTGTYNGTFNKQFTVPPKFIVSPSNTNVAHASDMIWGSTTDSSSFKILFYPGTSGDHKVTWIAIGY